jgi:hypothetical protein
MAGDVPRVHVRSLAAAAPTRLVTNPRRRRRRRRGTDYVAHPISKRSPGYSWVSSSADCWSPITRDPAQTRNEPTRCRERENRGEGPSSRTLACAWVRGLLRRSWCLALARARSNSGCIRCSLDEEKGIDEECDKGARLCDASARWRERRGRRSPLSSMLVSPAERNDPQRQRWRTASASDRSSNGYSCAPPQCSRWNRDENISTPKWRAVRKRTQ